MHFPTSILFLTMVTGVFARAPKGSDIVIADFESETFGEWKVEGPAFGPGPASGSVSGQGPVTGFRGKRFANSFHGTDVSTGKLTSPEFKIKAQVHRFPDWRREFTLRGLHQISH